MTELKKGAARAELLGRDLPRLAAKKTLALLALSVFIKPLLPKSYRGAIGRTQFPINPT